MSSHDASHEEHIHDYPAYNETAPNDVELGPGMGWLLPLFLLVMLIALILYFVHAGDNAGIVPGMAAAEESVADTTAVTTEVQAADSMNVRKTISLKISDSISINAYQDGVEKRLLTYLSSKSPADSISKNRWFDFDNLNFKSGSAELTASSMEQVKNIAAILNAYPNVKIKIGGYTDKTGDEKTNMQLSQARADAVLNALKHAGADPRQLAGAEGYGSAFAQVPADAPDAEKAKDRRISINVRAK